MTQDQYVEAYYLVNTCNEKKKIQTNKKVQRKPMLRSYFFEMAMSGDENM